MKQKRSKISIPGTVPLDRAHKIHEIKNKAAEIIHKPLPGYGLYVHNLYITGTLVLKIERSDDGDKAA